MMVDSGEGDQGEALSKIEEALIGGKYAIEAMLAKWDGHYIWSDCSVTRHLRDIESALVLVKELKLAPSSTVAGAQEKKREIYACPEHLETAQQLDPMCPVCLLRDLNRLEKTEASANNVEAVLQKALFEIMCYGSRSIIKPEDRSEMCRIAERALEATSVLETPSPTDYKNPLTHEHRKPARATEGA